MAGLIFCLTAPFVPHCWQERQQAARLLEPLERSNAGYGAVGQRLSRRFQNGDGRSGTGLRRMRLQRQRGTWDMLLILCGGGALISGWVLLKGPVRWAARQSTAWWQEGEEPGRKK